MSRSCRSGIRTMSSDIDFWQTSESDYPSFASNNSPDMTLTNLILLSKRILSNGAQGILKADRLNLSPTKTSKWMIFSMARTASASILSILRILYERAKIQMLWIYAGRIITTMQHTRSIRNRPDQQKECCSMRSDIFVRRQSKETVSSARYVTLPNPASASLLNLGPETFLSRLPRSTSTCHEEKKDFWSI